MTVPAPRGRSRRRNSWHVAVVAFSLCVAPASSISAADQVYFPSVDNVTNLIVQKINAETVRLDIGTWYLTEHAVSIAIANRFHAGVPVRLLGDRGSIFEIDANTRREFYWLASQGVPIRLRYNPTWYPEINHWKMGIFVGQGIVEFGSANWTAFELAPILFHQLQRQHGDVHRRSGVGGGIQGPVRSDLERHDGRAAEHRRRAAVLEKLE